MSQDVTAPVAPPQGGKAPAPLLLPLVIVVLALLLRLWGIGWGLPNAERFFSYHPDESDVVIASLQVNPLLLLLDPQFYNYGALPLLLNGLFIHVAEWFGLLGSAPAGGLPPAAFLIARLVTVGLGTATCLSLYGVGRLMYGRAAGLTAAALYAVAPLAVQHGHFATVDVPATFFIAGSLYFAARHTSPERRARDLFWCGVWAGLAAACKYNAGLVLLAGLPAWWQTRTSGKAGLAALLGGAALGFVAGCPPLYLNPAGLFGAIAAESLHVRTGHGDVFKWTPPGFIYHIGFNLRWGVGWPLTVAALIGVAYAVYRRRPGDAVLAAFALPYYLLIGLAQVKFARYTLPLFPPLLLWIGALVPPPSHRAFRPVAVALAAAGAFALFLAVGFDSVMTRPDPRDQAAAYLREKGVGSVGFPSGPWYYSPTLAPGLTTPRPALAQKAAAETSAPRLIPCVRVEPPDTPDGKPKVTPVEWDRGLLESSQPDAVALSEYEYGDALRIGRADALAYLAGVRTAYPNRQDFANPVQVFGIPVTNLNDTAGTGSPLFVQKLPHDMLYTNPTTVIYAR